MFEKCNGGISYDYGIFTRRLWAENFEGWEIDAYNVNTL